MTGPLFFIILINDLDSPGKREPYADNNGTNYLLVYSEQDDTQH